MGRRGARPDIRHGADVQLTADLIVITALLGSASVLSRRSPAWMSGTSFGGIGSSREMMFASLAEPAMIMIVSSSRSSTGSTQLSEIAFHMLSHIELRVSYGLALIGLVIVAIAENGRIPVDNPATHLELTMVHEAMALEYSGRHLAVIELASALKLLLYVSLIACIFAPWVSPRTELISAPWRLARRAFVAKMAVGGFSAGAVRSLDRRRKCACFACPTSSERR